MNWGHPVDNRAQQAWPPSGGKLLRVAVRARHPGLTRISGQLSSPLATTARCGTTPTASLGLTGKGPTYPCRVRPWHPHHRGRGIHQPVPTSNTSGSPHRQVARKSRADAISSWIERPFIATSAPVGATSGIDHPSRRSRGATARDVTTSKVSAPCRSSARPRTTRDLVQAQLGDDLVEERRTTQQRLDERHPRDPAARWPPPAREGRRRCRCRTPTHRRGWPRPARRS